MFPFHFNLFYFFNFFLSAKGSNFVPNGFSRVSILKDLRCLQLEKVVKNFLGEKNSIANTLATYSIEKRGFTSYTLHSHINVL